MFAKALRSSALLATLLTGAALLPSSLRAQGGVAANRDSIVAQPTPTSASSGLVTAPVLGPRIAPAGITRPTQALNEAAPAERTGAGSDVALMGVGVAAVVVGLMIGGDGGTLMALGGGALGLLGLYRYLR